MTAPPTEDTPERSSHISERKQCANRENAQRSTGPRTEAGKKKSARNAETHGAYSGGARAISRGPFTESQDDLDDHLAQFMGSAPPDVVARALLRRMAMLHWRLGRVDRYEAEILSAPAAGFNPGSAPEASSPEDQIAALRAFGRWLVDGLDDDVNFEHILARMRRQARIRRHVGIESEEEPPDAEDLSAQARVEWHIEHTLGGLLEATQWALDLVAVLEGEIIQRDRDARVIARKSLADMDKVSVITQRLTRELDGTTRQYHIRLRQLDNNPPHRSELK